MRERKTFDEWHIYALYEPSIGWECVFASLARKEALDAIKSHRTNEPQYQFKIVKKRVKVL